MRDYGLMRAAGYAVKQQQEKQTTMRYHPIPETGSVPGANGEPIEYPYSLYLDELVWNKPCWRDNVDFAGAYNRLRDAYDGKKFPDVVPSTDEDFEKFLPNATMKGKDAPLGPLGRLATRYAHSALFATTKKAEAKDADPKATETPAQK